MLLFFKKEALASKRNQPLPNAFAEGFGARVDREFREHRFEVVFHGVGGDAEAAGDDFVAHAFGDEAEDFGFARGEQRGGAGDGHADVQAFGERVDGGLDAADGRGAGQDAGDALVGGEGGVIGEDQDGDRREVGGQAGAFGQIEDEHVGRGVGRAVEHGFELPGAPGVGHQEGDAGALGGGDAMEGGFDHLSHG